MRNLLAAERFRLRRSPLFWLLMTAALLLCLPGFAAERDQALREAGASAGFWAMDEAFFQFAILNGVLLSGFLPLYLSTDYRDGTLRNKLIAGHSRSAVYLSALFTAFLVSFCLTLGCVALNLLLGRLSGGLVGMGDGPFALYLLASLCCGLAFASVYTMLCLLVPNQAFAVAACLALFFILAPVAGGLNHALRQEAMIREFLNLVDGRPVYSDPIPNPQYISGLKRTVFVFLLDLTPFGQGALLSNVEAERVSRFPALSLLFSALCTGCGLLAFSRKNIK